MSLIEKHLQDLTHLEWSRSRASSGTAGSFLKSNSVKNKIKTYYKLSNYDSVKGIVGHECINEIIACRLLDALNIPHLDYDLIHADVVIDNKEMETYLCASKDFKNPGESKMALDTYYQMERRDNEAPLEFCIRMGWEQTVYDMLLVDYLILNRDRHGANIEVLRDRSKKTVRLAPLFDHGLSLLFSCSTDKEITDADILKEGPVQSFLGSNNSFENIGLIPKDKMRKLPQINDKLLNAIFKDLTGIMSDVWIDKTKLMLVKRAEIYENIRNL